MARSAISPALMATAAADAPMPVHMSTSSAASPALRFAYAATHTAATPLAALPRYIYYMEIADRHCH